MRIFLMAVATIGSYSSWRVCRRRCGYAFYQIGELFQSYAVGKSRRNIGALMDIRPDYAGILEDGVVKKVDPDEVSVGSIIVVQPGEKCPD